MTATREQEYVTFHSPGTFFHESSTLPIGRRDTELAVRMAATIMERHGAKPFGFTFETRLVADPVPDGRGGTMAVQPKVLNATGMHFIGGKVLTLDDVPDTKENAILRSNMRWNRFIVCQVVNGWKSTNTFRENDVIVDVNGQIIEWGDDPKWVAIRKSMERV